MGIGHTDSESAQHFRLGKTHKFFLCSKQGSNHWSLNLVSDAPPIEPPRHPACMPCISLPMNAINSVRGYYCYSTSKTFVKFEMQLWPWMKVKVIRLRKEYIIIIIMQMSIAHYLQLQLGHNTLTKSYYKSIQHRKTKNNLNIKNSYQAIIYNYTQNMHKKTVWSKEIMVPHKPPKP